MKLATSRVTAKGATPERTMLFLHGILGRGSNWRSIARRFVAARPSWEAVLVDLRAHGASPAGPGPHTVATAADDLFGLSDLPVQGILGHSFGGKVALAYAEQAAQLEQVWIIDSDPAPRPDEKGSETTARVRAALRKAPKTVANRQAFVDAITSEGISEGVARWLTTNLVRENAATLRFGVDLDAVDELLADYFVLDQRPIVEGLDAAVHLVIGERSEVFGAAARQWSKAAEEEHDHVQIHCLPTGHWVHSEAPEALAQAMIEATEPL